MTILPVLLLSGPCPHPSRKSKSAHNSFFVMCCTLLENARRAVHPQRMFVNLQARVHSDTG